MGRYMDNIGDLRHVAGNLDRGCGLLLGCCGDLVDLHGNVIDLLQDIPQRIAGTGSLDGADLHLVHPLLHDGDTGLLGGEIDQNFFRHGEE